MSRQSIVVCDICGSIKDSDEIQNICFCADDEEEYDTLIYESDICRDCYLSKIRILHRS